MHRRPGALLTLLLVPLGIFLAAPLRAQAPSPDSSLLAGLKWRNVGPANTAGRVTDIEGIPSPSKTFYVAAAAGGIWKTTNNGVTFQPVFDVGRVISMGDLAIAPSDTLQVWAGTGEEDSRNSISPGGGIYKSVDGGKSWKLMGLEATQAIGRIVVHPTNPDIVYVAALGHPWGPNKERGLYKTTDGGKTWTLSKFVSDKAGFVDVAMDPRDPNVLYAASWERVRGPYFLKSGGPGSALWKTTDGGATWTEVKGGGFPETTKGRIGLAVAPSNPDVVYALVEADSAGGKKLTGLYRSADAGKTWTMMNDHDVRPFYYSQVRVDPSDPDRVYWSSTPVNFSKDGGKTVGNATLGIHVDQHAFWWDPKDPQHFIVGDDGGISMTWDKGGAYDFINTFAIAQPYEVSYNMAIPYRVCAGLQDNGTWCGPSRRAQGGIDNHMWYTVAGGDGFHSAQDPTDPNTVYAESQGGNMSRVNTATGERTTLRKPDWRERVRPLLDSIALLQPDPKQPVATDAEKRIKALQARVSADSAEWDLRFNWNTPFLVSKHDPNVFYVGGNRVLRSTKRGEGLEIISPDLSYRDTVKIRVSMRTTGGITKDATGAETYATVVALAESPLRKGVLYAGTDDGRLWVTKDDGKSWQELTAAIAKAGAPKGSWIRRVEPSHFDENTFYLALDRHRDDDFTPYLYVTTDGGKSFRSIAAGLPKGGPDFVHVVREDPTNRDLLFVGTDVGAYVSLDRGATWQRFMTGLPTVPVHDLQVHPRDHELIAATHGRGIWIVDIAPLQQYRPGMLADAPVLFQAKPALQYGDPPVGGESAGHKFFRGQSAEYGAEITYWVPRRATVAAAGGDAAEKAAPQNGGGNAPAAAQAGGARGRRGGPGAQGPQAKIVVLNAAGDTVQTLNGPARPGLQRAYWNLRSRPEQKEKSPSERRDSLELAQKLREVGDSLIKAGKDSAAVERIVSMAQSGDRGAMFRMFGGGGDRPTGDRPGESYPSAGAGAAGRGAGGQPDPDAMRELAGDIMDAVRPLLRGGPGGGRRGAQARNVDPGDYTIAVTVDGKTLTGKVQVLRAPGFGTQSEEGEAFGLEELLEELGIN
ncbi:MAG TPA: hypothetical protein VFQ38_10330 [Longimicrobiales bacterium]|nr:hypothetical protein [Longimicrobiales bacterium]